VTLQARRWQLPMVLAMCAVTVVVGAVAPADAFLLLVVVGALIMIWREPAWGVAFMLVLIPLNDLVQALLQVHGGHATTFGALKDALLGVLLIRALPSLQRVPRWLLGSVALVTVLAIGSAALTPSLAQAAYGFRNDVEPLWLLVVVPCVVRPTDVRRLLALFVLMGEVASVIAIATWTRGLGWLYTLGLLPVQAGGHFPVSLFTSGDNRPRAFSPYTSADDLGQVMAMVLAAILFRRDWPAWRRILLSIPILVALVLTRSRSGILGAILVVLFATAYGLRPVTRGDRQLILAIGMGCLLAIVAVFTVSGSKEISNSSTAGHVASVSHALTEIPLHPLGYGLGTVGPRATHYTTNPILVESSILLVPMESGIINGIVFLGLLITLGRRLLAAMGDDDAPSLDQSRSLRAAVAFGALIASAIPLMVLPSVQEVTVMDQLWLLVGIGLIGTVNFAQPGVSRSRGLAVSAGPWEQ
jgi:putative inorganic carbon (HCO3(-)) transporter